MKHGVAACAVAVGLLSGILSCGRRAPGGGGTDAASQLLDSAGVLSSQSRHAQALPLLDSALVMARGDDTLRAYILAETANDLLTLGRMDEALPFSRRAIALGERTGSDEVLINQYSTCGILYRRLKMADSALWAYRRGIEVAQRVDAKDYVANLYNNIAVLFVEQDRLREGADYAEQAMRWAEEAADSVERYSALATKASALLRLKRHGEAARLVARDFPSVLRLGYAPLVLKVSAPMLRAFVDMGQTDSAAAYLRRVRPALQASDPASNGAIGILEIEAALLHRRGDYAAELALWQRIDTLTRANHGIPAQRILASKADCCLRLGRPAEAYELMRRAYAVADSLKNSDMSWQMSEFTAKYRTVEKELEIARLGKEKADQQLFILMLLLAVVVLAALVAALSYRRRTARREHAMQLQRRYLDGLEGERARLARELHDGVCNEILGMRMKVVAGAATADDDFLGSILRDVRQISHELMPPRFGRANIAEIVGDYVRHYPLGGCALRFGCTPLAADEAWNGVGQAKSYELYRIMQELVGNAARHARPGILKVELALADGRIRLLVENDGAGEGCGSGVPGIGLATLRQRVESMAGEMRTAHAGGTHKVEVAL